MRHVSYKPLSVGLARIALQSAPRLADTYEFTTKIAQYKPYSKSWRGHKRDVFYKAYSKSRTGMFLQTLERGTCVKSAPIGTQACRYPTNVQSEQQCTNPIVNLDGDIRRMCFTNLIVNRKEACVLQTLERGTSVNSTHMGTQACGYPAHLQSKLHNTNPIINHCEDISGMCLT